MKMDDIVPIGNHDKTDAQPDETGEIILSLLLR